MHMGGIHGVSHIARDLFDVFNRWNGNL